MFTIQNLLNAQRVYTRKAEENKMDRIDDAVQNDNSHEAEKETLRRELQGLWIGLLTYNIGGAVRQYVNVLRVEKQLNQCADQLSNERFELQKCNTESSVIYVGRNNGFAVNTAAVANIGGTGGNITLSAGSGTPVGGGNIRLADNSGPPVGGGAVALANDFVPDVVVLQVAKKPGLQLKCITVKRLPNISGGSGAPGRRGGNITSSPSKNKLGWTEICGECGIEVKKDKDGEVVEVISKQCDD